MKIHSVRLKNFGSYNDLSFDFEDQGLTLIHGPTGSGKSTLCDAIPWILFGTTAKGGAVNEVLSWGAEGPTEGIACLDVNGWATKIFRTRNPNDLYYIQGPSSFIRGKDLNDTQKMINNLLGMDADLYLAGAYYHEFSQTAQFFQTTPKNRRAICEHLVDLSLPLSLQEKTKEKLKSTKNDISKLESEKSKAEYKFDHLTKQAERQQLNAANWEKSKADKIKVLYQKMDKFESDKAKFISTLEAAYKIDLDLLRSLSVCSECGTPKTPNLKAESHYKERIEREKRTENTFAQQLLDLDDESNPFVSEVNDNTAELALLNVFLQNNASNLKQATTDLEDLELLSDVVDSFRATLMSNTIEALQTGTNQLLSEHFDAEIRVEFDVTSQDKVEVQILKDGNLAAYTQLSKGQRGLLKLCFGVSVMKVIANYHAIKFHQIFFDEALDGLDSDFKLKAVNLLQSLESEYESIFLVEHSLEIKAFISNSYYVQLINGSSVLNEKA